MIYLYEPDRAGGHGVSDVFRRAYGEDAFASFYCPHPVPPYLEASRIGYLNNYFGAAMVPSMCSYVTSRHSLSRPTLKAQFARYRALPIRPPAFLSLSYV